MKIGLRIDVDTFRGTKVGVPNLCRTLAKHDIRASFFFSLGPDNMGRHLWRLLRPGFFIKMLRTKAASLYGWDILFKGTFRPGPIIGERLAPIIISAAQEGHEIGLHAWDHHAWQAHVDTMDGDAIYRSLNRGVELLTRILGRQPACSAVPGWKCKDLVLMEKAKFSFDYNSDCRGVSVFRPFVEGKQLSQPQIPVTLPTYDEVIGSNGITDNTYNDYMLSLLKPEKLNVLTIHAEVEGMACFGLFDAFLNMAQSKGASFVPLGALSSGYPSIGPGSMVAQKIPGREGWISCQAEPSYMSKSGGA